MRRFIIALMAFILCGWGQVSLAQTGIVDNEQYNSYELRLSIDNLLQGMTSDIFEEAYYSKLKQSDYKATQTIIISRKVREVRTRTRKTKSGASLSRRLTSPSNQEY